VVRVLIILSVLTFMGLAAAKAGAQIPQSAGPQLSARQQAEMSHAIATIERSGVGVCEMQRRFRAAMYQILTLRQRQELVASLPYLYSSAQRKRIRHLQESTYASLRACQQTRGSCVAASRAVAVVSLQSSFDPLANRRCQVRHRSTKAAH
jgi:hypothetical protein